MQEYLLAELFQVETSQSAISKCGCCMMTNGAREDGRTTPMFELELK